MAPARRNGIKLPLREPEQNPTVGEIMGVNPLTRRHLNGSEMIGNYQPTPEAAELRLGLLVIAEEAANGQILGGGTTSCAGIRVRSKPNSAGKKRVVLNHRVVGMSRNGHNTATAPGKVAFVAAGAVPFENLAAAQIDQGRYLCWDYPPTDPAEFRDYLAKCASGGQLIFRSIVPARILPFTHSCFANMLEDVRAVAASDPDNLGFMQSDEPLAEMATNMYKSHTFIARLASTLMALIASANPGGIPPNWDVKDILGMLSNAKSGKALRDSIGGFYKSFGERDTMSKTFKSVMQIILDPENPVSRAVINLMPNDLVRHVIDADHMRYDQQLLEVHQQVVSRIIGRSLTRTTSASVPGYVSLF